MRRQMVALAIFVASVFVTSQVQAYPFSGTYWTGFTCISNNNAQNCKIGEEYLRYTVGDSNNMFFELDIEAGEFATVDEHTGAFIRHSPTRALVVTHIYFDDNYALIDPVQSAPGPFLNGDSSGLFIPGVSPPDLPFGTTATPPFVSDYRYAAYENPAHPTGVWSHIFNGIGMNRGLQAYLSYRPGVDLDQIVQSLVDGNLRIGLYATYYKTEDYLALFYEDKDPTLFQSLGSESFINNPYRTTAQTTTTPEPSTLVLVLSGIGRLVVSAMRKAYRANPA